MSWVLTLGLQNLRAQVNEAFPDRDKASDGTIGDAAHAAGISGHNPDDSPYDNAEWDGDSDSLSEVRAIDIDTGLNAPPATAQQLVDHIRHLPNVSSVLRYIIYNRRIYRASAGWAGADYDGPSPHTEHIHFSGAYSQASDNNTTFDFKLEEIPVALTSADKTWILANTATPGEVRAQVDAAIAAHLDEIAQAVVTGYRIPGTNTEGSTYLRNLAQLAGDPWFMQMVGETMGGDPVPPAGVYGKLAAQLAAIGEQLAALAPPAQP